MYIVLYMYIVHGMYTWLTVESGVCVCVCVQIAEVGYLSGLPELEDLYLHGNPIKQSPSYRSGVFSYLPSSANKVPTCTCTVNMYCRCTMYMYYNNIMFIKTMNH